MSQGTDAPYPFNQPSADIILRSCEAVNFRVHSLILAQASPFFAGMFELPQPPDDSNVNSSTGKALPVIDLPEEQAIIDLLLRLLYPLPKPTVGTKGVLTAVMKAALKYEMAWPVAYVSEKLLATTPLDALQVWAAACASDLEDVARQAAEVLRTAFAKREESPASEVLPEAVSEIDGLGDMPGVSAADYFRLKWFVRAPADQQPSTLLRPPIREATTAQDSSPPQVFRTDIPFTDISCSSSRRESSQSLFLAHQSVLALHSPVLSGRIASARASVPSDDPGSDLLHLELEEDAQTVSNILDVCYRAEAGVPVGLSALVLLIQAARKYEMSQVSHWAEAAWPGAAARQPVKACLLAVTGGLPELAKVAALKMLQRPAVELEVYTSVMETVPALTYHRLLLYYDACRQSLHCSMEGISRGVAQQIRNAFPQPSRRSPAGSSGLPTVDVITARLSNMTTVVVHRSLSPGEALRPVLHELQDNYISYIQQHTRGLLKGLDPPRDERTMDIMQSWDLVREIQRMRNCVLTEEMYSAIQNVCLLL